MMDAGSLTERITLQTFTETEDEIGQPIASWTTLATVWANVRYGTGREFIAAGGDQASTTASFRIRRRTDVTTAMRISYAGKLWNIAAVLPDTERREYVDLPATVTE